MGVLLRWSGTRAASVCLFLAESVSLLALALFFKVLSPPSCHLTTPQLRFSNKRNAFIFTSPSNNSASINTRQHLAMANPPPPNYPPPRPKRRLPCASTHSQLACMLIVCSHAQGKGRCRWKAFGGRQVPLLESRARQTAHLAFVDSYHLM